MLRTCNCKSHANVLNAFEILPDSTYTYVKCEKVIKVNAFIQTMCIFIIRSILTISKAKINW